MTDAGDSSQLPRPTFSDLAPSQLNTALEAMLYISGALKFLVASPVTNEFFCTPQLIRCLSITHNSLDSYSREFGSRALNTTRSDCLRVAENIKHVLLQVGQHAFGDAPLKRSLLRT